MTTGDEVDATSAVPAATRARLHPFVVAAAFSSTFYVALLSPVLPAIVTPKGGGALTIGLLFAGNSLTQFLTAPTWGALGDRFGRRPVLLASMAGVTAGFLVFAVGASAGGPLWMLFAGWMIVGACDCWVGTAYAHVADGTAPAERTRYFAYLTAGIGSGFILGPGLGALLAATGTVSPLHLLLVLLAAELVWGWAAMPESLSRADRADAGGAGTLNPVAALRGVLSVPTLRVLLLGYFLFWLAVVVLPSNLPTMTTDVAGWGSGRISVLLLIFGVLVVGMQSMVVPRLVRHVGGLRLATTGALLAVAAFALLAVFAATGIEAVVYAGVVVFGLGQPLVQTCLTATMSTSSSAEVQGRVQGAVAATMAAAQVTGSLAVGALYGALGPLPPYLGVAGLLAVSAALMAAAAPMVRRHAAGTPGER